MVRRDRKMFAPRGFESANRCFSVQSVVIVRGSFGPALAIERG
jgi:hypothetical protein